jgi:FkbM family methyltransferase
MRLMGTWLMQLTGAVSRRIPLRARLALYRLGPLTGLVRRTLNAAAPRGVHPVRVASGDLQGRWLLLDLQVDKDLWLGTYEPHLTRAILRFAAPGGLAWDLGANVGYTSLLLAQAVGEAGSVVAFEPLPANLERLRQGLALNRMEGRVRIVPAAVGERSGRGTFRTHASGAMGRLDDGEASPTEALERIQVEVIALDEFVFAQGNPAPNLIKADLEGGEGPALRGMVRLLREARPILLVELHGAAARASVETTLRETGYTLEELPPGGPWRRPGRTTRHVVGLPQGPGQ